MKTISPPPEISGNSMSSILRLERNNKEILSLKDKLNSYICEPKTPKLYEQMESLKNRMECMRDTNLEMINVLRNQHTSNQYTGNISKQLREFQKLENNVFEYIGMARMHC